MRFIFQKKTGFIVSSLLVLGAAISGAQWKWHFWPLGSQNSPPALATVMDNQPDEMENAVSEDSEAVPDTGIGIREVLSAHLFGQAGVTKKLAAGEAVPKTQQPLELHGIVFIPNHPERAVALIAQAGGMAKDYKTGEEISILPGWKVYLISADSVQIEHDGTVELLELPRDLAQSNSSQPGANPAAQFNPGQPTQEEMDAGAENAPLPSEELQPAQDEVEAVPENVPPPQQGNAVPAQDPMQPVPVNPAESMQTE